MPMERSERTKAQAIIVLFFITCTGIVACSPRLIWIPMKTIVSNPNPSRLPQTLLFLHGYVTPPHCNASSRQTIAPIRNVAPIRSISLILLFSEIWLKSRFGFLKKPATVTIVRPPNGKLIQKHHRQVSLSVKTPPKIGPTILAMPNILLRHAR